MKAWSAVLAALTVVLVPRLAVAEDDPGIIPLEIAVGQATQVGAGPVRNLICDDPTLVEPVFADGVPALKGIRAGSTLCSLTDTLSMRRVFRVKVVNRPSPPLSTPSR